MQLPFLVVRCIAHCTVVGCELPVVALERASVTVSEGAGGAPPPSWITGGSSPSLWAVEPVLICLWYLPLDEVERLCTPFGHPGLCILI